LNYLWFYRKDHQWTPGDGKNQQKIGIGGANMNSSSTTWPNQMPMGGAFGGVSSFIQSKFFKKNLFLLVRWVFNNPPCGNNHRLNHLHRLTLSRPLLAHRYVIVAY
jgi:hypothetical protein